MVKTLNTTRLRLRPLRAADAGPMTLYASDPRVARMTTSIPHPYPPGAAEHYIANREKRPEERVWAIDASPIGGADFVGVILFREVDADIGYWVGPPFWNTGYASEALQAILQHVMEDGKWDRLTARVFEDNPASAHVLEKAGYVETGRAEAHSVARGAMVGSRLFALTRERVQGIGQTG